MRSTNQGEEKGAAFSVERLARSNTALKILFISMAAVRAVATKTSSVQVVGFDSQDKISVDAVESSVVTASMGRDKSAVISAGIFCLLKLGLVLAA
jgi:hypothetical protein